MDLLIITAHKIADRAKAADIRWSLDEPINGVRTDVVYKNEDSKDMQSVLATGNTFYNQLAVQCQQVAEKYLKGYLDKFFVDEDISDLLQEHNMKRIASRLNTLEPELRLNTVDLAYLTDFYFDERFSEDDFFYNVTKEDFEKCLSVMYDTVSKLKKAFDREVD